MSESWRCPCCGNEYEDRPPPSGVDDYCTARSNAVAVHQLRAEVARLRAALHGVREGYQTMFDVMPVAWQTYDEIARQALEV